MYMAEGTVVFNGAVLWARQVGCARTDGRRLPIAVATARTWAGFS